mgnify:CR=1 FL=1
MDFENANVQMTAGAHSSSDNDMSKILVNNRDGIPKYDFMTAMEIAGYLGIGKSQAYEICKMINEKLAAQGFLTFRGKVPRQALLDQLPKQGLCG